MTPIPSMLRYRTIRCYRPRHLLCCVLLSFIARISRYVLLLWLLTPYLICIAIVIIYTLSVHDDRPCSLSTVHQYHFPLSTNQYP